MKALAAKAGRIVYCTLDLTAALGLGAIAVGEGSLRDWPGCLLFALAAACMWESGWSQLNG